MVKREHPEIDLTADEHDGEPVAQRARVEEPDHLLCPIMREMFRDPVMLVESGHTYEREAIERHLRGSEIDPRSNVRIGTKRVVSNWTVRNAVQAWLEANPRITPDGWDAREMLPARAPSSSDLHSSAENGRLEDVRYLIEAGADVNAKGEYGYNPLYRSAENGHLEVVRYLIEAGAYVNAKTE